MNSTTAVDPRPPDGGENTHAHSEGSSETTATPTVAEPIIHLPPEELRALPQWVVWAYAVRDGKKTKVPWIASKGGTTSHAASDKPSTWRTYSHAVEAAAFGFEGVGFVFSATDPYCGVDFDNCLDENGELHPWARPLVESLAGSYAEISPSGRGLKFWVRGTLPNGKGTKRSTLDGEKLPPGAAVECYDRGRFFTVTGRRWGDSSVVVDKQDQLLDLHRRITMKPPRSGGEPESVQGPTIALDMADDALLDKARKASNGAAFSALYDRGDITGHRGMSEAIYGLLGHLYFWTQANPERMRQLYLSSALGRANAKRHARPELLADEIAKVIAEGGAVYSPPPRLRVRKETGTVPSLRVTRGHESDPDSGDGTRPNESDSRLVYPLTDMGNGERMADKHGSDVRYCHLWKKWLYWDGRRWADDTKGEIRRKAKATVRSIYAEAAMTRDLGDRQKIAEWAMASESRARVEAMAFMAQAEQGIPVVPDDLDQDPWSFNVLNGTIDLRTGDLRPHRREDRLTKLCPVKYDRDAKCPLWDQTVETFLPDPELRSYFRRLAGYCISGVVEDHIFPIAYGTGSNGKSTMLGTLLDLFGPDYAMKAPADFLIARKGDAGHPTDKADLFGKRLVIGIETEDGGRLNETLVKELTGGDRIRARRMREDHWEFDPSHKLWLATNHKPEVRGTDNGIWRRALLIPFLVQMPTDKAVLNMNAKLRAEFPGILAWCVRGCLEWQRDGIKTPKIVRDATAEYRSDEDVLGGFIAERCVTLPGVSVRAGVLHKDYKAWAESGGHFVLNMTRFGKAITEKGFRKDDSSGFVVYHGIGLRPDSDPPSDTFRHFRPVPTMNGESPRGVVGDTEKVSEVSEVSETPRLAPPVETRPGLPVPAPEAVAHAESWLLGFLGKEDAETGYLMRSAEECGVDIAAFDAACARADVETYTQNGHTFWRLSHVIPSTRHPSMFGREDESTLTALPLTPR